MLPMIPALPSGFMMTAVSLGIYIYIYGYIYIYIYIPMIFVGAPLLFIFINAMSALTSNNQGFHTLLLP